MINIKKNGRPKKTFAEKRSNSVMVQITNAEVLKLHEIMKELTAGSLSNTFRILLNNFASLNSNKNFKTTGLDA